ncbi:MAG: response regulator transcription factor [bacterium]|nr:response regulator transcription factor [bacterium]
MTQPSLIRVGVVDDNDMLRYGLSVTFETFPDVQIVGEGRNGQEAIDLCRTLNPDVLLIDLIMPEMNGVTAIRRIRREMPNVRCIALTSYDDAGLVYDALNAGAISYLIKNMALTDLIDAIRRAMHGETTVAEEALEALKASAREHHFSPAQFTEIERCILDHMANGRSDEQIADAVGVEVGTVKQHIRELLATFKVSRRSEALVIALRDGLISIE